MSALARENGWRGFDGIGDRVPGGYEYRCDGMPSPFGCHESVVVTRRLTRPGIKRTRWLVCYGLDDDGTPDHDVVLTFCPACAVIVATQTTSSPRGGDRP